MNITVRAIGGALGIGALSVLGCASAAPSDPVGQDDHAPQSSVAATTSQALDPAPRDVADPPLPPPPYGYCAPGYYFYGGYCYPYGYGGGWGGWSGCPYGYFWWRNGCYWGGGYGGGYCPPGYGWWGGSCYYGGYPGGGPGGGGPGGGGPGGGGPGGGGPGGGGPGGGGPGGGGPGGGPGGD